ncbi:MAG: hypothetical protein PVSMB2_01020 [Ktedonobacteraceae bacterium]
MSFTKDELQSFNTILEQKLTQQRRELERGFDQRLHVFKREIEQRLVFTQQDLVRVLAQHLSEHYRKLREVLGQRSDAQHVRIPSTVFSETELKQQLEDVVEHALDTQLISFDQLIAERFAPVDEMVGDASTASPNFAEMELHTEIPLDELSEAINKTFDARFSALETSLKMSITGIERLELILESMQVAMTSNHALLSNRMYHHQQLPLERAHPASQEGMTHNSNNTTKKQLPLPKE